jgi:hypothetical protein
MKKPSQKFVSFLYIIIDNNNKFIEKIGKKKEIYYF